MATHNTGKLVEIQQLLAGFGVEVVSAAALQLEEPEEIEASFAGNARLKAHTACKATGLPSLADDSGMCVDGLGGDPGLRTADWAQTASGRDYDMAMRRVWDALCASGTEGPHRAQFRCALALAWPDGHDEVFEGVMRGQIVWPGRGHEGHGFDPIFQPDGFDLTFGEMEQIQKNAISHRSLAVQKLVEACFT